MGETQESIVLKTAKEIVVKFIEVGRVSPSNFNEVFKSIYQTVKESVRGIEQVLAEDQD